MRKKICFSVDFPSALTVDFPSALNQSIEHNLLPISTQSTHFLAESMLMIINTFWACCRYVSILCISFQFGIDTYEYKIISHFMFILAWIPTVHYNIFAELNHKKTAMITIPMLSYPYFRRFSMITSTFQKKWVVSQPQPLHTAAHCSPSGPSGPTHCCRSLSGAQLVDG